MNTHISKNPQTVGAIILIVLGVLGLVYGGFNFMIETGTTDVGQLSQSVSDSQPVQLPIQFPIWLGLVCIAIGGALLVRYRKTPYV